MVTKKSRPGLAEEIVATLKSRIDDATYEPGSRLPTEAQLCEEFAVSRATVRSAIKELDVVGLVFTRQGLGTYVRSIPYVQDGLERACGCRGGLGADRGRRGDDRPGSQPALNETSACRGHVILLRVATEGRRHSPRLALIGSCFFSPVPFGSRGVR